MASLGETIRPRTTWLRRQPSAPNRSSRSALRLALASPLNPGNPTATQTSASSPETSAGSDVHQFDRSTTSDVLRPGSSGAGAPADDADGRVGRDGAEERPEARLRVDGAVERAAEPALGNVARVDVRRGKLHERRLQRTDRWVE